MKKLFVIFFVLTSQLGFSQNHFSLQDTTFELGAIHQFRVEYVHGHPPLYQDPNQPTYDSIADFLKRNPNVVIEIASHTDQRGSDHYNQLLSQRRADNIKASVIEAGANPEQMVAKGYGEIKPIYSTEHILKLATKQEQEEAYGKNRRLELVIIAIGE